MTDFSGYVDNITQGLLSIVGVGFQVGAGVLEYLRDNMLQAIAGVLVIGLLLSAIPSTSKYSIGNILGMFKKK